MYTCICVLGSKLLEVKDNEKKIAADYAVTDDMKRVLQESSAASGTGIHKLRLTERVKSVVKDHPSE